MKITNLYDPGVPCVATVKELSDEPCKGMGTYFLNPKTILRYEPDGGVVFPPVFNANFLWADTDLIGVLEKQEIDTNLISRGAFDLLLKNEVIQKENPGAFPLKKISTETSGLPCMSILEVTSDCNCFCEKCYHIFDLGCHYPRVEDLKKRVLKIKELGIGCIDISGGEPFIYKPLKDILTLIIENELNFSVSTNGYHLPDLSQEMIEILRKGLGVTVSLDGVGEVHNQLRRKSRLYERIIFGTEKLLRNKVTVYFRANLNIDNLFMLKKMVELAKKYGTKIILMPTIDVGNGKYKTITKRMLQNDIVPFLGDKNVENEFFATRKEIVPARYYGCGVRKTISVNSYGIVYPCVTDRSRALQELESYDQRKLVLDLEQETSHFLQKNQMCSNCQYNKEQEPFVCGGVCRFSNSFPHNGS